MKNRVESIELRVEIWILSVGVGFSTYQLYKISTPNSQISTLIYGGALVSTGIVGGMVSEPRTLTALKRGN